jgi:DNA topoisomerase VI subunit A
VQASDGIENQENSVATTDDPEIALARIELALESLISLVLNKKIIPPLTIHHPKKSERSYRLTHKRLQSNPDAYIRLWCVLDKLHSALVCGTPLSQRELYYHLKSIGIASSQRASNVSLRDAVGFLQCTRRSLGVKCASRGLMAGRVNIIMPDGSWVDCTTFGSGAFSIPGAFGELRRCTRA